VVDQSLLRQAADRGVTICFADLDGADGLWVPEERTVLVNRGLSDAKVADVIEHELAHVMIDDQHADLDAGKDVVVGQPPWRSRRREMVALAAAAGLVAVIGGVTYGINAARGDVKLDRVAPNPGPGLTANESGTKPSLSPSRGPDGRIVYVTVTPPAPTRSTTGGPSVPPSASATATRSVPSSTASRSGAVAPLTLSPTTPAAPPVLPTSEAPAQTSSPPDTTTPVPSTPADESAGGVGDTGDQGGGGGTEPAPIGSAPATVVEATVVDASIGPQGVVDTIAR
jgi:hypothetical protein